MKTFTIYPLIFVLLIPISCNGNEDSNRIEGTGSIEIKTSTISSKVAGSVDQIFGLEGADYKKDDILVSLEHDILDLNLKQAEAARDAAKSKYDLLKTGARKEDLQLAEEQLKQAKINLDLAETDNDRIKTLYNEKAVTKKQYDDVNARYFLAKSQHTSAEKTLEKIKDFAREEDLQYARAMLKQAEANLDLIKENIENCYIKAPFEGTLIKILVELGETAGPGSAIVKFANTKQAELIIYISETELGKVKPGQKAEIRVDSFTDKTFEGTVSYISTEAEFTPKNIQTKDERTKLVYGVKINIPNPDNELKAGMPADAEIIINTGE